MMRKIILALFIVFLLSSCNMFELNKREIEKQSKPLIHRIMNLEELQTLWKELDEKIQHQRLTLGSEK